jgi:hypothetical protein
MQENYNDDVKKKIIEDIISKRECKTEGNLLKLNSAFIYVYTKSDLTPEIIRTIICEVRQIPDFTLPLTIIVDDTKEIKENCSNYCNILKNNLKLYKISNFNNKT